MKILSKKTTEVDWRIWGSWCQICDSSRQILRDTRVNEFKICSWSTDYIYSAFSARVCCFRSARTKYGVPEGRNATRFYEIVKCNRRTFISLSLLLSLVLSCVAGGKEGDKVDDHCVPVVMRVNTLKVKLCSKDTLLSVYLTMRTKK